VAQRYARTPNEVDDIAQDALLRAWRRRATLRSHEQRAEWLASIARNEACRRHSRAESDPIPGSDVDAAAEDERILSMVEQADVRGVVRKLGRGDRLLLHLRYEQDMTIAEIAGFLEIPVGTAKVRLHRMHNELRSAFEMG
jgi:RNA polymerase sigma-70 factor (ECF subfamily)